jgi:hypothetical protein
MQPPNKRSDRTPTFPDPMKYFSKDGPGVRLSALFICKLPQMLTAGALLILVVSRWLS